MKKFLVMMMGLLAVCTAQAHHVTTTFAVRGDCKLCEARIEKAAHCVRGVCSASWNQKKQRLTLVYDSSKTTPKKVACAIAAAGHDTQYCRASASAYNKIPSCCHYRAHVKTGSTCAAEYHHEEGHHGHSSCSVHHGHSTYMHE